MNGRLYDLLTSGAERRAFARLRGALLCGVHGSVVDVGAGTGANFVYYPAGAQVAAVEPDPGMRRRAQQRLNGARANITLVPLDDRYLATLPDASIDAVVFTLGLCTIADPLHALRQAKRVLRATGRVIVLEHVRGSGRIGALQDAIAPLWGRIFGGCRPNQDTYALLRVAGFDASAVAHERTGAFSPVPDLIAGSAAPIDEDRVANGGNYAG